MDDMRRAKEPVTVLAGPYGHPFHPILVTVPIGAWVASFVFEFISFATNASPAVDTTPTMDSIIARWFAYHCREIGQLRLNWHKADSYRRYTVCIAGWAEDLDIEPEQVEQLIFGV